MVGGSGRDLTGIVESVGLCQLYLHKPSDQGIFSREMDQKIVLQPSGQEVRILGISLLHKNLHGLPFESSAACVGDLTHYLQ